MNKAEVRQHMRLREEIFVVQEKIKRLSAILNCTEEEDATGKTPGYGTGGTVEEAMEAAFSSLSNAQAMLDELGIRLEKFSRQL